MSFVDVMWLPFLACVVLIGIHAYLGMHVLTRGVIFVDLALAQLAALGAALGVLAGFETGTWESVGCAMGLALLGAGVLSLTRVREAPVPQEAIIGLTYVIASAAVVLVLDRTPHGKEHIEALLTGSILWVSPNDIITYAIVYAVIGAFHVIFRKRFLLISEDPDEARRRGYALRLWDFLFYASFALVVTLAVGVGGVLIVFTFLIGAPVIAFLLARSVLTRLLLAWGLGVALSMVGLGLSYQFDLPTGAAVVCVFGAAIIVVGLGRRFVAKTEAPPA